jgi:hypothetical protein
MTSPVKKSLGIGAIILAVSGSAALADGCGHAAGPHGGTVAFERAHPQSGGEHGGFWGGWKGLADGCVAGWDSGYPRYGDVFYPAYDQQVWHGPGPAARVR